MIREICGNINKTSLIYNLALKLNMGDHENTRKWMETPNELLGNLAPADVAFTPASDSLITYLRSKLDKRNGLYY